MKPVLHTGNTVERGTLTSTGATATSPVTRLADGDVTLPWVDSAATGTRAVTLDLGSGQTATARALLLASGHNVAGVSTLVEVAANPAGPWTAVGTYTPTAGLWKQSFAAAATGRLFRLSFTAPATAPSIAEWVLSDPLTLPSGPQEPQLVTGPLGNVQVTESPAGYVWTRKRGASRWEADYMIRDLTASDKAALETAFAASDEGARPFYLEDADGILRWVSWITDGGKLAFQAEGITRWRVLLRFRQAL